MSEEGSLHRVGVLDPAVDPAQPPVEMGRAGPEADPGALESQMAELRRVARGRQRGRRPEKGGAPGPRGHSTERDLVERLGLAWSGRSAGVGAGSDGLPWTVNAIQAAAAGSWSDRVPSGVAAPRPQRRASRRLPPLVHQLQDDHGQNDADESAAVPVPPRSPPARQHTPTWPGHSAAPSPNAAS